MVGPCQKVIEPDKNWSWTVAFACWMVNLCTNGLLRSQGVLYVALMNSFGVNRQAAAWPFSLCIATACFSGVLSGVLLQAISVRQVLFLTGALVSLGYVLCSLLANDTIAITIFYGIIAGFGNGFVTPCLAVITNLYFQKHRATANGISLSGIACGALIFPYLTPYLLDSYGLRGAFLILGGFALNVMTGASLLRPGIRAVQAVTSRDPDHVAVGEQHYEFQHSGEVDKWHPNGYRQVCQERVPHKASVDNTGKYEDRSEASFIKIKLEGNALEANLLRRVWILFHATVRDPLYHLISLSALSSIMVLLIFVMIIVDHAVDVGVGQERAALLLTYFSVPDLLGRLGSGWVSDRGFVRRKSLFAFTKAFAGFLMLVLPWLQGELALSVLTAVLGLAEGVASILTNVLFVEYLGLERLATALSLWSFSIGVVFLTTPSLIGLFRDLYGHYDSMFYLMSALSLTTAFAWCFEPWLAKGTQDSHKKAFQSCPVS